jgi:MFS family permease
MRFDVKDTLTEKELESGLRQVVKDGLTSQAMVTLTSGAFLVAFALKLGASNLLIGLLAAIPPLAQLLQVPSIYLIQKVRNRRAISVVGAALSRVMWFLIALIPFLFAGQQRLSLLALAILVSGLFAAAVNASWNSWMRDLVPQDRLGSFFSRRLSLATALAIVLSLAAAVFLDFWKKHLSGYELQGYSILFFAGFAVGMLGVYFISTIPEPRMAPIETGFFKLVLQPFKDANFRNLIRFLGPWNFAVNLAAPFFVVYMLQRLGLGMSSIIGLTVLSQLMNFSFLRIWGRLADRFSNKSVLAVSGPLFMLCILAWTFTTLPGKYAFTVPLLIAIHVFMGVSLAGVTLASGNIGLKLAPKGQATSYLVANNLVNSLAAGLGPILGGRLADFFAKRELTWTLNWKSPGGEASLPTLDLQQWDFLFAFAVLIGLYSMHRLTMVREIGEVKEKVVLRELIAESRLMVRNLSSVGGIRQMVQIPLSLFKQATKKKRLNRFGIGETEGEMQNPPGPSHQDRQP